MRAYGHPRGAGPDDIAPPIELRDIAIEADEAFLEALRDFAQYALDDMRRLGEAYDHVHFQDKCENWRDDWPDIVLIRRERSEAPTEGQ